MSDALRLAQLIVNRILGTISPEEEVELDVWINSSPGNAAFMENEIQPMVLGQDLLVLAEMDEQRLDEKIWKEIEKALGAEKRS